MRKKARPDVEDEWIRAMLEPTAYPHPVTDIRLLETHISWILLTGEFAYKIKKPVNLGFVDFSTLERRHYFCREELRLNRRTAPDLYLDVVPIRHASGGPRVGEYPASEYAVRMRQFSDGARLDQLLDQGRLEAADLQRTGMLVAKFHDSLPPWRFARREDPAERAARPARNTLRHLLHDGLDARQKQQLDAVAEWTRAEARRLGPLFRKRYAAGRVRECHGDLHLANLYREGQVITPFDCLEFDPRLRRIDVASDAAFLVMDLIAHGRQDLAFIFLNQWLEDTGDYDALGVLRFYLVYRAMVRVKVASVRMAQSVAARGEARAALQQYLGLARSLSYGHSPPSLVLMHGLSGSGKTWVSERLSPQLPAIRVRSDVERKRLHGIAPGARSADAVNAGVYTSESTRRTYAVLAQACQAGLGSGFHMIADASFPDRARRRRFIDLARQYGARVTVLHCRAEQAVLRRRIRQRAAKGADASDADLAVLAWQQRTFQPPAPHEPAAVVSCRTDRAIDWYGLRSQLVRLDRSAA